MSASLLQKSLKLTEDNKGLKKKSLKKKKSLQHCKWRSGTQSVNVTREKKTEENIISNIKALEELDTPISLEVAEKIFARKHKIDISGQKSPEEEKTVFTEKDFEEFEKEYFAS